MHGIINPLSVLITNKVPNESKYSLANFSPEEGKKVLAEVEEILNKNNAQFVVAPLINQNGTIGAKVEVYKKVELIAKDIPTPYLNGEDNPAPEKTA